MGEDPDCNANNQCNPKNIIRAIEEVFVHEQFNGIDSKNDIALIRLNDSVPLFNENPNLSSATPICLPWYQEAPGRSIEDNKKAIVSGWGDFRNFGIEFTRRYLNKYNVVSKPLRKLEVNIANEKCKPGDQITINPNIQLCAGGEKGVYFYFFL